LRVYTGLLSVFIHDDTKHTCHIMSFHLIIRFGGNFSFQRMSWIKTNFLWMMYRCGWAQKPNQERILAVKIPREHFDTILKHAYTAEVRYAK